MSRWMCPQLGVDPQEPGAISVKSPSEKLTRMSSSPPPSASVGVTVDPLEGDVMKMDGPPSLPPLLLEDAPDDELLDVPPDELLDVLPELLAWPPLLELLLLLVVFPPLLPLQPASTANAPRTATRFNVRSCMGSLR